MRSEDVYEQAARDDDDVARDERTDRDERTTDMNLTDRADEPDPHMTGRGDEMTGRDTDMTDRDERMDQGDDLMVRDDQLSPDDQLTRDDQLAGEEGRGATGTSGATPMSGATEMSRATGMSGNGGEPRAATPMAGDGADAPHHLFGTEDVNRFRGEWREIQAKFVDDPQEAVRGADHLVSEVMDSLTETFNHHKHELEEQWHHGDNAETENLRQALRRYRTFFDQLLNA